MDTMERDRLWAWPGFGGGVGVGSWGGGHCWMLFLRRELGEGTLRDNVER